MLQSLMRFAFISLGLLFTAFAEEPDISLSDEGQGYDHVERFIEVLESVRTNHPNADQLSYERLVNHALEGMLGSLDKFSAFYHPETYAVISEKNRVPELPGLGITLSKSDDRVTISAVRDHSPADKARIAPGDKLLAVNGQKIAELSFVKILDLLGGPAGETVSLELLRKSNLQTYEATILRTLVKQEALPDYFLLEQSSDHKVGYIRLTEFTGPSHRELEAALDELEDQGMKSLIFDLRGNPGGLLDVAVKIAGEFTPPETALVFTKGRNPQHNSPPLKTPERKRKKRDYPLVILQDRNSASASELVAGALQDLKRATIIGEQSYGKGSVQNIMPLGNGTALRITIATYHTPSGNTPHEIGITPDKIVTLTDEDRELFELWQQRDNTTPEQRDRLANWQDPTLASAIQQLTTDN